MTTIFELFAESAKKHAARTAQSWKAGKRWHSRNYHQLLQEVEALAVGLSEFVGTGDRLAILSENRPEWLAIDLAANKLGAVTVPIHTVANQDLIEYVVRDAEPRVLAVSDAQLRKHEVVILNLLDQHPQLSVVIFADWSPFENGRLHVYHSLLKPGLQAKTAKHELASIVYTSGTTGEPKGVMLSNDNIIANIRASIALFNINFTDSFLSFLPLSHVLERTLGSLLPIAAGARISYAQSVATLQADLKEVKPTILISVPRIFERMQDRIFTEIKARGGIKKSIFYWSLRDHKNYKHTIAEILVHSKIRGLFGGHLRFAVSGGAAIHPRIIKFFDHVGIRIVEGYGLTETAPVVAANRLEDRKFGTVGQPYPDVDIKLSPDKEILVKGPNVMAGYYKKQTATEEAFTDDGYFRTGDLGYIDDRRFITIIGRIKDIIVTSNGKNIYPEKIETLLNINPYIAQSLVVGHRQDFVAALLVPDLEALERDCGGKISTYASVIEKEISRINKELMGYEQIRKFHLLEEPFTMENGELTPTLKVRRHVIEKKLHSTIKSLFHRPVEKKAAKD